MIQIISPTRIEVDGKDAGLPVDYILANPGAKREINAAFIAWHASHVIACQAKDADVAAAKKALDAEMERLRGEHAAHCEKLEADIATLGTKEEAVAIRTAQERTRKLTLLAQLQAELRIAEHPELEPADIKP